MIIADDICFDQVYRPDSNPRTRPADTVRAREFERLDQFGRQASRSNGQIQRQRRDSPNISVIQYESYAFDLSTYGGVDTGGQSQLEVPTLELINPSPDNPIYISKPKRLTAELHARLTGWLHALAVGMLVLAYLGDPVSHRQGHTMIAFVCCVVAVGTRALSIIFEGAARESDFAIFMLWALPLTAIAASALLLAMDRKALPEDFAIRIETIGRRASEWVIGFLPGRRVASRNQGGVA